MKSLSIHIGHHFYGAGNIGDDLMMAGFIEFMRKQHGQVRINCPIPFDHGSQKLRFPEINWLPFTPQMRIQSIRECDVWLGLGDTPFQTNVGPWFLNHLMEELQICQQAAKPMYFLGVGVNNREALSHPFTRQIVAGATHIWTRDPQSADMLASTGNSEKITAGSDLAHIYLHNHRFPEIEKNTLGFFQNYEHSQAFDPNAICRTINNTTEFRHRWLVQEVREMAGAERDLYRQLPQNCRTRLKFEVPDYRNASLASLLGTWGTPEVVISSRYHASLTALWAGAKTVVIRRSDKLSGLAVQTGTTIVDSVLDTEALVKGIRNSATADTASLHKLAILANHCCEAFLADT